jgi:PAS domain-containing protein
MRQTEQLEANRADLDRKRAIYEMSFNLAPDACIITNPKFQIQNVNLAGLHLLGQPLAFLIRMPLFQFISMADRHAVFSFVSVLQKSDLPESEGINIRILPPRREPVLCSVTVAMVRDDAGIPVRLHWLMRDIMAQRKFEEAVRHSEKIEAMSDLVDKVTNEFNNILAGIVINAGVARISSTATERSDSLHEIQANCEKAASLFKKFEKFRSDAAVNGAPAFIKDSVRVSGDRTAPRSFHLIVTSHFSRVRCIISVVSFCCTPPAPGKRWSGIRRACSCEFFPIDPSGR